MNKIDRRGAIHLFLTFLATFLINPKSIFASNANKNRRLVEKSMKKFIADNKIMDQLVKLDVANVAEDGRAVPIQIDGGSITASKAALWVDNNPRPKIFEVEFSMQFPGNSKFATRIRMKETSTVRLVIIGSDKKAYSQSKVVQVAVGGCG
ncbi:MAG: thiosulfate oxidation carrier protein SoxY [Nitrospinota bacterium]